MSCFKPMLAVDLGFKESKSEPGKIVRDIRFLKMHQDYSFDKYKSLYGDKLIMLPCGHCYGCACDYAKEWASRIMLEADLYPDNCFITLTYDEDSVPDKLTKRPFQLFMKRLRKAFPDKKIRYFACGEIGEGKGERDINPHYHAILFNLDFTDKVFLKRSKSGLIIYRSKLLEELWPYGISSIGDVSPESAQYVAKYSLKRKVSKVDNGEFVLMSRMPGIGAAQYSEDNYLVDAVYTAGKRFKIPRYFDKLAEKEGSILASYAKELREQKAKSMPDPMYSDNFKIKELHLKFLENNKILKDSLKVRL